MAIHQLDARGMRCPQPTLKISVIASKMHPGDILEVIGDCSTFEGDVRSWCKRAKKAFLSIQPEETWQRCRIQF